MSAAPHPFAMTWPAEPASVPAARHAVLEFLHAANLPAPSLGDVALAVSEALSNAVLHAYAGCASGEVRVTIGFCADQIEVSVEDDGSGFKPRSDAAGLGLGLPLLATLTERFEVDRGPRRGTRLRLWFCADR